MPDENIVDNPLPATADPLLEKIKNVFLDDFEPVHQYHPGVKFMSTQEIYLLFTNLYPNEAAFSAAELSIWLHNKGFSFIKMKEMEYHWMLNPVV
jgi:hypothetical protein